jgi:hypothetical protein
MKKNDIFIYKFAESWLFKSVKNNSLISTQNKYDIKNNNNKKGRDTKKAKRNDHKYMIIFLRFQFKKFLYNK